MPQLASKLSEYRTTAYAVVLTFYFDIQKALLCRAFVLREGGVSPPVFIVLRGDSICKESSHPIYIWGKL